MIKKLIIFQILFIFFQFSVICQVNDSSTVSVIGVGDIMLGTSFPSEKYLPPGDDCHFLLEEVKPYLQDADIVFGNLEGSFLDDGPVVKKCKDTTKCYAFRSPEKYFDCLVEAGFNLFSLANNHMNDFGVKGQKSTVKLIEENSLHAAGLLTREYEVFEKDSVIYGFCAFSPNKGTTRINDYKTVRRIISLLNDTADIIIVSFHGGAEGADYTHVPREHEIFYGEDRGDIFEFARIAIDEGADIIFGHGPHVPRAIDLYKDRFIAYSLGNFCTYGRMKISGVNGLAPAIKVHTDKMGKFVKAEIIPFKQSEIKGTYYDPYNSSTRLIQKLTLEDIPESNLKIQDNGVILKKNL